MAAPLDITEGDGQRRAPGKGPGREPTTAAGPQRKFLSVWFRCCHVYGRLYRNRDQTAYEGRCPRCGARVGALIGPHGTDQRMFEAY